MDGNNRKLLDYQVRSYNLQLLDYQTTLKILDVAKNKSIEDLRKWNPYNNKDILNAIRLSRLDESSIILFDLDGYDEYPDNIQKREGLYSLILEVQNDFANMIIGYPQIFMSYNRKESKNTYNISWDMMNSSKSIPIDEKIWNIEPLDLPDKIREDDIALSRINSINYHRWSLSQRAAAAQLFIDQMSDTETTTNTHSLVFDIINSEKIDGILSMNELDPLEEILQYLNDLDNIGFIEFASNKTLEKFLKQVARRVYQTN